MNPILFASTETKFDTNGLGVLSDAISCIVTEERNGSFELTMQYSVEGIHYADISDRSIILAKPSPMDNPQPFRVYRHTKPLNGIVTFYARHISYDLSGTPVGPFTATNVIDALNKLKTNAVIPCPFEFWTDKVTSASMNVRVPSDIFALLGGQQGSVLDVYGGEYKFDGYTVRLYNERGTDRGVSIRYGKNLLDLEQEKNCANVCTGVYPYWVDSNGENLVQLEDKIVNAPGTYDFVRIKMLDLSSEWQEAPSTEQLKARAETYIKENNIGVPTISLTVSHAMLENTEEYKGKALLERIDLCDTARIEFPKLGVSASAKAVKTEFNALLNRYESITFGDARYTLADNTVDQKKALEESSNKASGLVAEAMKKLNEIVQNSSGLYTTEEIQSDKSVIYYYHDKPNLTDSKNVIKFTADAIGLSTDGGKTYPFGFTVTGDMVANILSAIGVNANWINAGILQSMPDENGERNFTFDLETGEATVKNLSIHGQTADEIASEKANSALKDAQGYADSAVNNFVSSVYDPRIDELQKQIDGQIESYFYDYEPKLDNVPASDWTTDDEKKKHEGDLFYWKSKGYAYRFFKDGDTWKWQLVRDTDVTKALEEAANAQHTADGKSRTFINEPVPPYDEGDQWYRGENSTLVCTNSRQSGAFDMSDWEKLDNYADGKETIYSVQAQYYLSTSPTALDGGNWSNTQPTWTQGKYIWSRQYVTYGDGHHAYTPSETGVCITGNTGANGTNGTNGTSAYTHIRYSANANGSGFITEPNANTKYIGIYTGPSQQAPASNTAYTWSKYMGDNGTNGTNGKDGNGIRSITYYYATTQNQTAPDAAKVTGTTIPTLSETNKYLWQKEVIDFTDSSVADKTTVILLAVYGDKGKDGTNGTNGTSVSIRSTSIEYQASSNGTTAPSSGWSKTIPSVSNGQYLWTKTTVTYSDGTSTTAYSVAYKGTNGANGDDGIGIETIVAEYYVSNSATALSGGSWSTAIPAVQDGKYIWFHQKITYTDGNVEYAGEYCMTKTVGDIAQQKVDAQTQQQIFNKLTNNGELQGLYMQDGELYINASFLATGILQDKTGKKFYLDLDKGDLRMDAGSLSISGKTVDDITQEKVDDISIGGTNLLPSTKTFMADGGTSTEWVEYGVPDGTYSGFTVLTLDRRISGDSGTVARWTNLSLEPDTDYTLSFYVRGSGRITSQLLPSAVVSAYNASGDRVTNFTWDEGEIDHTLSAEWERYWVTWHTKSGSALTGKQLIPVYIAPGGQVWCCGVKFEKGSKATDWSPAPMQGDVFSTLTNNGALQGLYMQGGQLYINAQYLRGDTIDLNNLKLIGTLCGLMQGEGRTGSGNTTTGIVQYGNGINDDGTAKPPYTIVTSEGIRLQIGFNEYIYFSNGIASIVNENFTTTGTIHSNQGYGIGPNGGHTAIEYDNEINQMTFGAGYIPGYAPRTFLRGFAVYINEDEAGYATYIRGSDIYASKTIQSSSDRRLKKDIEPLYAEYESFLDNLSPVSFRYKLEKEDAPKHLGYVAQDVEIALKKVGHDKTDTALVGEYETENGERYMSIAYEELIAALHMKVKNLETRIKKLEER